MDSLPLIFLVSCLLFASLPRSLGDSDKQVHPILTAAAPPPPPSPPKPDYHVLALQWPISVCNDVNYPTQCDRTSAIALPLTFTIHGLWPNKNSGAVMEFCTNEALNPSRITGLTDKLKKLWPNVKKYKEPLTSNSLILWEYEWKKHGTCSGLSQESYFELAINLIERINILSGLPTRYVPGNRYDPTVMAAQISQTYAAARIICNTARGTGRVEQFLELRFKVNLDESLLPMSGMSCSSNSVLLPSGPRTATKVESGSSSLGGDVEEAQLHDSI